jgi:predicted oxidoreductase
VVAMPAAPENKRTRPAATPDALRRLTAASPTTSLPESADAVVVDLAAARARRWLAAHGLASAPVCGPCCTCWGQPQGWGCSS